MKELTLEQAEHVSGFTRRDILRNSAKGITYRGTFEEKPVAVTCFPKLDAMERELAARRSAAEHANIVPVVAFCRDPELIMLAVPLLPVLDARRAASLCDAELLLVARDVAHALEFLQKNSIGAPKTGQAKILIEVEEKAGDGENEEGAANERRVTHALIADVGDLDAGSSDDSVAVLGDALLSLLRSNGGDEGAATTATTPLRGPPVLLELLPRMLAPPPLRVTLAEVIDIIEHEIAAAASATEGETTQAAQLRLLRAELEQLRAARDDAQQHASDAQTQLAAADQRAAELQTRLESAEARAAEQQTHLDDAQKRLDEQRAQLDAAEQRARDLTDRQAALELQIDEYQRELQRERESAKRRVGELEASLAAVRASSPPGAGASASSPPKPPTTAGALSPPSATVAGGARSPAVSPVRPPTAPAAPAPPAPAAAPAAVAPKPLLPTVEYDGREKTHEAIVKTLPKNITDFNAACNAHFTDATLEYVAKTCGATLQVLWCGKTTVGDVGVRAVLQAAAGSLRTLYLYRTRVTDASLVLAAACTQLTDLSVECTAASDVSLVPIFTNAKLLCGVDVSGCGGVTDKALKALVANNAGKLRELYCKGSGATKAGAAELQKKFPKADVRL